MDIREIIKNAIGKYGNTKELIESSGAKIVSAGRLKEVGSFNAPNTLNVNYLSLDKNFEPGKIVTRTNFKTIEQARDFVAQKNKELVTFYNEVFKGNRMVGAASIAGLGTIGAGAAVVAGWAYPAHKLGEYLGTKLEERKIKRETIKRELNK